MQFTSLHKIIFFGTVMLYLPISLLAQNYNPSGYQTNRALPGDSVQSVLRQLARTAPQVLAFVPETGRLCLVNPSEGLLDKTLLTRLQDAFYYDVNATCKFYGEKYLADWRVLVAKASRETCWGTSYLCNRANNFFGIRRSNKEWACASFSFCDVVLRPDPEITEFVVFPNFETSLWMFMHTIYSPHFLERLPDSGSRVWDAIRAERQYGVHYWQLMDYGVPFPRQLNYTNYNYEELLCTWSEYPINNLCVNCSRQTDRDWVLKVHNTALRARI
jgi:hypothetical protein